MLLQKTRPITDFLPRIMAHIEGADEDMVAIYTMDSAIQFLRDTKILTEVICLSLEPCISSYALHTKHPITEVLSVRFFSDNALLPPNTVDYRIQDGVFYVGTIPPCYKLTVEVELALAPERDSEVIPAFLYEHWADAIVSLTLSKLYLLTGNDWYNPQASNNQMSLYYKLARQARISKVTRHKPLQMRFGGMRRR